MDEALDVAIAAVIVLLAASCLHARDRVLAISMFVAYGLLMALAWVRLDSPDLALAEAGIGAGVTGALLLSACRRRGG